MNGGASEYSLVTVVAVADLAGGRRREVEELEAAAGWGREQVRDEL